MLVLCLERSGKAVALLALLACLHAGGQRISACVSTGCNSGCIINATWCAQPPGSGQIGYFYNVKVVGAISGSNICTDGSTGGSPAINGNVVYDVWSSFTSDCASDLPGTLVTTGAVGGTKTSSNNDDVAKTSCNNS